MDVKPYVLVVGYRQQLAQALDKLGIAYSVWSEKKLLKSPGGVDQVLVRPIPSRKEEIREILRHWNLSRQPTHIISGTENAVFPSATIRREYHARCSAETLLMRCTDKAAMKRYLYRYGIPMADFVVGSDPSCAEEIVETLRLPVVVKNRRDSGSRNIVIARDLDQLKQNMRRSRIYESFIEAHEGSVESYIQDRQIVFSNVTDYFEKKHINLLPAAYEKAQIAEILELNNLVIKALNIRWGLTHLEFYRTKVGILFGEIALRPPGGYIMELLRSSYQFDPWEAYVKVELGLPIDIPRHSKKTSACQILHPGSGEVKVIWTPDQKALPSLKKFKLKRSPGSLIEERQGVGEDIGYLFLAGSHEEVVRDINRLQQQPVVKV